MRCCLWQRTGTAIQWHPHPAHPMSLVCTTCTHSENTPPPTAYEHTFTLRKYTECAVVSYQVEQSCCRSRAALCALPVAVANSNANRDSPSLLLFDIRCRGQNGTETNKEGSNFLLHSFILHPTQLQWMGPGQGVAVGKIQNNLFLPEAKAG